MSPLDLVFVHEGRRAPLIGEFIKANENEMRLHVIWGPKEKIGHTVVVDKDNLQDYTVPSFQMQSLFAKTGVPEELKQKGKMYIVTDRPTMYPNFAGVNVDVFAHKAKTTLGLQKPNHEDDPDVMAARASFGIGQSKNTEDPNMSLARDFLKGDSSFIGKKNRGVPTFNGLGRHLARRTGGTPGV